MTKQRPLFTPTRSLVLAVLLFCAISFTGQYVKFVSFGYNGLDLAIYSQVIHESSQGRLFAFTIHPHSYLGDHVELFLLILVPFYWLWGSPLTLLALQTAALGLAAIPIYRFARRRLGGWWGVGAAGAYLLSPFVWNANFFEFHILPFAIPLLLAVIDAYDRRALKEFWLWSVLALTVREDVALVMIGIGLLAIIQRRKWTWSVPVLVVSTAWFFLALYIAKISGTLGQYKFLSYYGWLGPNLPSIVKNFFIHPLLVIKTFFSLPLFIFLVGLILPFALLPVLASVWLFPTIPIILQLGLGRLAGALALETHYNSLLIPFLFTGAISGLYALFSRPHRSNWLRFFAESKGATAILLATITIYSFIVIGPIRGVIGLMLPSPAGREARQLKADVLSYVPKTTPLATSYSLISQASERRTLASLHYVYLGSEQFSDRPYRLPESIKTVLIDEADFLFYQVAYQGNKKTQSSGDERYRQILSDRQLELKLAFDDLKLYGAGTATDSFVAAEKLTTLPADRLGELHTFSDGLTLHCWTGGGKNRSELALNRMRINQREYRFLPLTLYWSTTERPARNDSFILTLSRGAKQYTKEYSLAPLLPPTEWTAGDYVATSYRFFIPADFAQPNVTVAITLMDSTGSLALDGARSIAPQYKLRQSLGTQMLGTLNGA